MMRCVGLSILCILLHVHVLRPATAQTVQLPTFRQFSVNTTVSVPDGGSALLGGVNSARSGSTTRAVPMLGRVPGVGRLFQNQGIGNEVGYSGARVHATIIDHREWDEAVLAAARAERVAAANEPANVKAATPDPVEAQARFLTKHMGRAATNLHMAVSSAQASPPSARPARRATSAVRSARPPEPPLVLKRK